MPVNICKLAFCVDKGITPCYNDNSVIYENLCIKVQPACWDFERVNDEKRLFVFTRRNFDCYSKCFSFLALRLRVFQSVGRNYC